MRSHKKMFAYRGTTNYKITLTTSPLVRLQIRNEIRIRRLTD